MFGAADAKGDWRDSIRREAQRLLGRDASAGRSPFNDTSKVGYREASEIGRGPRFFFELEGHMKNWLSVREIADELEVSRATVALWCRNGVLPAFRAGHLWKVSRRDFDRWIADRTAVQGETAGVGR